MAAKKDFSRAGLDPVAEQIASVTQDTSQRYTEIETADALETMSTQGRKGMRLPRINLAFSTSNHQYLQVMAQVNGVTLTEMVNTIIQQHREQPENAEQYAKAQELLQQFKQMRTKKKE